jgi:hypothetical protein
MIFSFGFVPIPSSKEQSLGSTEAEFSQLFREEPTDWLITYL